MSPNWPKTNSVKESNLTLDPPKEQCFDLEELCYGILIAGI